MGKIKKFNTMQYYHAEENEPSMIKAMARPSPRDDEYYGSNTIQVVKCPEFQMRIFRIIYPV